MPLEVIINN